MHRSYLAGAVALLLVPLTPAAAQLGFGEEPPAPDGAQDHTMATWIYHAGSALSALQDALAAHARMLRHTDHMSTLRGDDEVGSLAAFGEEDAQRISDQKSIFRRYLAEARKHIETELKGYGSYSAERHPNSKHWMNTVEAVSLYNTLLGWDLSREVRPPGGGGANALREAPRPLDYIVLRAHPPENDHRLFHTRVEYQQRVHKLLARLEVQRKQLRVLVKDEEVEGEWTGETGPPRLQLMAGTMEEFRAARNRSAEISVTLARLSAVRDVLVAADEVRSSAARKERSHDVLFAGEALTSWTRWSNEIPLAHEQPARVEGAAPRRYQLHFLPDRGFTWTPGWPPRKDGEGIFGDVEGAAAETDEFIAETVRYGVPRTPQPDRID